MAKHLFGVNDKWRHIRCFVVDEEFTNRPTRYMPTIEFVHLLWQANAKLQVQLTCDDMQ